ncbi:phage tail length tape measure family protein [Azospirillum argentinense]|uniref:phage tail length tape measure family protein n=1 Tax=Azospirillum argentinense TaxID=2970906 RepID=UPI001585EFFE|nr:phage tail length tape measure family protein [Azospirillum argentinense]
MAVELAQALIHEVVVDDSKAVAGAQNVSRAMDGMTSSSDKATAAAAKQATGLKLLDEATVKLSRAQESAWGALQKWKAVADDNERAMQRLARAEADLDRAVRQGVATEQEKIRVLDQLRQKLSGYAAANDNAAASTGQFKGAIGNLGLQLQDVAVQAQMGTSAFIILAQQGPQIASAFGPAGIAIGTVVAIASVAAGVLLTLGDETRKSAKEIDTFGDVLGIFEGRARESGAAIDTLTDSYRALGGELRALSKLALQADIATLTEKRAKDQKSAWDAIRNATMSGAQDAPAALGALQQLGQDKDLVAFMGKLQALNEKGAIKLMRDEDIRALLETGEALRVAEARMADLEGRATPAQKALLGYADAAREAAKATREAADAAYEMSRAQGLALGSVIVQERDLDRKIAALKGGEAAMKAYGEEQIRTTAYDKAFKANLAAGESLLDARTEATRIATKAVEAYRLEQQRADEQKAANAADRKAESQAERDAKAYAKVSEELDRGIAEQQRLAGVVGQSVEAQREANTQTKIAEALSKAHTTASTAEGKAIAGKVREQEKWRAAAADAAVLDSSKRQLAYAEKELSLMGQAEPVRERALKSFQIQQEAQEKLKTTTPELVAQWVQYQEAIADTQAMKAFQQEIRSTAKEMSRDITEALLDRESKWSDLGKTIGKRIALGLIEANIVLPITTSIVGAVPSLFGIGSPANQNAANQNAANQNGAGGYGQYVQAGQSAYNAATGTNTLGTMANSFATSEMGYGLGMSSKAVADGTGIAAGYVDTVGSTQIVNGTTLTSTGQAATSTLGAIGAAAPYGMLGGMAGSYIGNAAGGNKAVGGLSGAAIGVGSYAAGTAAMGAMGASAAAAGMSGMAGATAALSAIPVYGWIAAAVLAAVTAIAGTQKPSTQYAQAWARTDNTGAVVDRGSAAASSARGKLSALEQRADGIASLIGTLTQAGGFDNRGIVLAAESDTKGNRYRIDGLAGPVVSRSEDGQQVVLDVLRHMRDTGELVSGYTGTLAGRTLDRAIGIRDTDFESFGKGLALARQVEAGTTALRDFDKSLSGVTTRAKQAQIEAFKPMSEELALAAKYGFDGEYTALVTGQLTSFLEDLANPRKYTAAQTEAATFTGQIAAMREELARVNPELVKTVDGIEKAGLDRIYKQVQTDFDVSLNEARGQGYRNSLKGVRDYWNETALDALASGRNPNDLYFAQAAQILEGLDSSQIDDVVSYFKDLDPVMVSLAESLRGTTTAAKAAQAAVQANADALSAWLNGQKLGDLSSLSAPEQFTEAQRQLGAALSGSDVSAVTKAADALLTAGRTMYGTTGNYAALAGWTTSSVTEFGRRMGLPGYAVGTDGALAGWAMVGEQGPELVRFRGGEQVYTAPQTRTLMGGGDVVAELREVRRELVASRQANTRMQQVTVGALALIQQAIEASTDAQAKAALQAKLAALLADQKSEAA